NHSTVVMMVDSSSEFWDTREFTRNDPLFGGTVQYATIGGEGRVRLSHETQQIMTEYNGEAVMYFSYGPEYYLIGDTNRASDTKIANKKEGQMVSASSEQIRSMLESNSNYALNAERDVPYTLLNPGLNSNSYARGILDSAEVAYNDPVGRHPNWEHPVPNQYFVD
ncbi:MAG: hypothetical protein FWG88_11760, partial [Oscillospiraceae bacterium]|nr:hypothetical protein [Oscillospiraceae bacterium]